MSYDDYLKQNPEFAMRQARISAGITTVPIAATTLTSQRRNHTVGEHFFAA